MKTLAILILLIIFIGFNTFGIYGLITKRKDNWSVFSNQWASLAVYVLAIEGLGFLVLVILWCLATIFGTR